MAKPAVSRALRLYGTEEPTPKQRQFTAGELTAVLDNGGLRYIRYRGVEVLRAIAYLLRDRNWGTYAPVITGLKVKQGKSGFSISYSARCQDAQQKISYDASIEASTNTLTFSAVGTPHTDFLTNRTGFVVLHPLKGIVGEPVQVVHTNGKKAKRRFPKIISPGQPIFEVRSLTHQVMPGVTATVLMEGNKFEMEDHRNWMDASYKTYVCSLLDPWPYTLPKDTPFTQSITLTLMGKPKTTKVHRTNSEVAVTLGDHRGRMPKIGVGVPMEEAQASLQQAKTIAAIKPAHLVCQLDGRRDGQREAARAFHDLSTRINAPVTLEVILPALESADIEIARIAQAAHDGGLKPDSVVITQAHDLKSFQPNTPRPWGPSYEDMTKAARHAFPGALAGGGMLSYFTELNRKPAPKGVFDFITHTVCPIVHAADDISVMETLEALPWIFASTRAMMGKTRYHLGPSGISCRDNPYGAAVATNPNNARVCLSDRDPRQRGQFAEAWNLGLISAAAKARLDSVTLGAATGPQGVIADDGSIFPAYHVLASLAPLSGARLIEATSTAPGKIMALCCEGALWLANLTGERQAVKVAGMKRAKIELGAYAVHQEQL
jgi:D-apionolactonase